MFKHNYNPLIITALTVAPIVFWYLAPAPIPRFSNPITTFANFGQMLGLAGTALFAINLILSARLKIFDKIFFGLNHMYAAHNHIGQLALIFLLAHPLFLIPKYAGGSLAQAFAFLMPSQNWNVNFGIFALATMILLIMLTLYLRPKYNIWKITHKFLGLAFFLASLHIYLIPSDVARYAPLRIYMLTLVALGLLAFFYHAILGRWLTKHYSYTVSSVKKINNTVVQINLKPIDKTIQFNPGQFAFISFVDKNISSESHPFSFASAPNDKEISVIAKRLGDYTAQLDLLSTGAKAKLEGPFGAFDFRTGRNRKQIWIAGGIGITPFLSMAESLAPTDDYQIDLYYCVKNKTEIIPIENKSQIKINFFCSDESGKINIDDIEKMSGGLTGKDFFICAPPAMIDSLRKELLNKKISGKLIHSEEFNF